MRRFFEEDVDNREFGITMLDVPKEPELNSYSKPLDSLDFYQRSQNEIGRINEEIEQMHLEL